MNDLKQLLENTDLDKVNWVNFFRYHSAVFKQASLQEREDFIRQYQEQLGFQLSFAAQVCQVSIDFVRQHIDFWVDNDLFYSIKTDHAEEFIDRVQDWERMFPFLLNFDQKFLERYRQNIDWKDLLEEKQFSDQFLNRNLDYFLWLNKKDKGLCIWKTLSYFQHLSDDFIQKYKNKLDWGLMSASQPFSENIMLKYMDKIDWEETVQNKELIITYPVERELKHRDIFM